DRPDHVAPVFQTSGGTAYLLTLPGTGRLLVQNGHEVTVEPEAGADATVTGAILTGPIVSVLWHQRDLLPLHASAVDVDGSAVALCGHSAAGKSTIAAVLAAQGHAVAADDICPVDARAGAEVSVLPGSGRLRLWGDALDHIGARIEDLARALSGK